MTNNTTTEGIEKKYLYALFSCYLLNTQLYALSNTPIFKQKIKNLTNQLHRELEIVIDQEMSLLNDCDDELLTTIMKKQQDLLEDISKLQINDIPIASTFIKALLSGEEIKIEKHPDTPY